MRGLKWGGNPVPRPGRTPTRHLPDPVNLAPTPRGGPHSPPSPPAFGGDQTEFTVSGTLNHSDRCTSIRTALGPGEGKLLSVKVPLPRAHPL